MRLETLDGQHIVQHGHQAECGEGGRLRILARPRRTFVLCRQDRLHLPSIARCSGTTARADDAGVLEGCFDAQDECRGECFFSPGGDTGRVAALRETSDAEIRMHRPSTLPAFVAGLYKEQQRATISVIRIHVCQPIRSLDVTSSLALARRLRARGGCWLFLHRRGAAPRDFACFPALAADRVRDGYGKSERCRLHVWWRGYAPYIGRGRRAAPRRSVPGR
jgi:hypothetical protein